MRVKSMIAATGLAASAIVSADINIKIPSVALTSPVTDSSATSVKGISGIGTYISGAAASSTASLTLFATGADAGAVKLTYNISNGADAYKAATGLLIPLDKAWSGHDVSSADSIYFDIRSDVAAGVNVNFLIGSDLNLNFGNVSAALQTNSTGDGFASPLPALKSVTTSWKRVGVSTSNDLVISPWYLADEGASDAVAGGSLWKDAAAPGLSIGTNVKNLQFQPNWKWGAGGAAMTNGTGSIYVRNVVIKHTSLYTLKPGVNCNGTNFKFDHFGATKLDKKTGTQVPDLGAAKQNAVGGYWFAFTDTSSTKPNDTATGSSTLAPIGGTTWAVWNGFGTLRAKLEKNVAGSTFNYHPYAGWADLGANFATYESGANVPVTFDGIKAISFDIYAGKALADSFSWDEANLPYILFKAQKSDVEAAHTFAFKIPVANANGSNICVDLDSLTQPSWYKDAVPFSPENLTQFTWEMIIDDQADKTLHTSGPNAFGLQNVVVYGLDSATAAANVATASAIIEGISSRSTLASGLQASYNHGLSVSYKMSGLSAQIDVIRADGTKVAGFNGPAVANGLNLAVSLPRGMYYVSVRGAGKSLVAALPVAR